MGKPQIVISGSIALDRIMNVKGRYRDLIKPEKLHALSLVTPIKQLELSPGGTGGNIAYHLARLGERPSLVASAGEDARDYIGELEKSGVDVSPIHFSELPTASFTVFTDEEDSQVGGFYQGAMGDADSLSFKDWQDQDAVAVISPNNPGAMNRQVQECREASLKMMYDPGQQTTDPEVDLAAGIDAADILIVNDYELALICDKLSMSAAGVRAKVPLVITTLAKEGSRMEGSQLESPIEIGIAKPDRVADPTGAGDAYRAGFLYGYVRQWELAKCGRLGAVMASFVVEQHGTQVPVTTEQVMARYKENFKEEIEL